MRSDLSVFTTITLPSGETNYGEEGFFLLDYGPNQLMFYSARTQVGGKNY